MLYRLLIENYVGERTFGDYLFITSEPGKECGVAMTEFLECYMPFDAEDSEEKENLKALTEKFQKLQDDAVPYVEYGGIWDDYYKVYKPKPVKPAKLDYDKDGNRIVRICVHMWEEVEWPIELPDSRIPGPRFAPDAHLEMAYEDRTYIEEA